MGRPAKTASAIKATNSISRRTKAEIAAREKAEKALASGTAYREWREVKDDPIAHKEFMRLRKLFQRIEKNDALFESTINRYCKLRSEEDALQHERDRIRQQADEMYKQFCNVAEDLTGEKAALTLLKISESINKLYSTANKLEASIMNKRSMMLAIEKENCMTIAAQLRAIPKKEEKASNPLLEALNG